MAIVAALGLLAVGLLSSGASERIDTKLQSGKPAPAPGFTLDVLAPGTLPAALKGARSTLEGGRFSLAEVRGTPVVMNFWASWCYPCRLEAPILESGWKRDGPRGVLYLGVNTQDTAGDARGFISKYGLTYPSVRDSRADVARSYAAPGLPETFFIDRRGDVVAHVVGQISATDLEAGVSAARHGRVAGVTSGGQERPAR